jgi:hypothetical protein
MLRLKGWVMELWSKGLTFEVVRLFGIMFRPAHCVVHGWVHWNGWHFVRPADSKHFAKLRNLLPVYVRLTDVCSDGKECRCPSWASFIVAVIIMPTTDHDTVLLQFSLDINRHSSKRKTLYKYILSCRISAVWNMSNLSRCAVVSSCLVGNAATMTKASQYCLGKQLLFILKSTWNHKHILCTEYTIF